MKGAGIGYTSKSLLVSNLAHPGKLHNTNINAAVNAFNDRYNAKG